MKQQRFNLLLFVGLLSVSTLFFSAFSSPSKSHAKVVAHFGEETVEFWKNNNPRILAYHTYFVDKGWYTVPMTQKETSSFQHIQAPLKGGKIDKEAFNILTHELKREFDAPTYVIVKGCSEMIIIRSEKEINKRFQEYYKSLDTSDNE